MLELYSCKVSRGFTLVELLIVIAILGILYSIAMPTYTQYLLESRRADVQQLLLQNAAVLERQYTRAGGYPATFSFSNSDYYTFSYQSNASNGQSNGRTYTLKATPKGVQSSDRCGSLIIDQTGAKRASQADCWVS
ncbi:type IV pilin protein [Pseudoalteromonas mariniglutinosa]|uniref:type IV pilin protein n=1 Tax=Pseudoalteromonas mariniglutinosa TaxID=206042 RepID=UPI00384F08F6